jgi:hypothetical protein
VAANENADPAAPIARCERLVAAATGDVLDRVQQSVRAAEVVRLAAMNETDPDARIRRMLGARGSHVAATEITRNEKAASSAA